MSFYQIIIFLSLQAIPLLTKNLYAYITYSPCGGMRNRRGKCGVGENENRPTAPMQIVKGDRNRQLRKDQGAHLKRNPPRQYGTITSKRPSGERRDWGSY